jgi:hypothetical protein
MIAGESSPACEESLHQSFSECLLLGDLAFEKARYCLRIIDYFDNGLLVRQAGQPDWQALEEIRVEYSCSAPGGRDQVENLLSPRVECVGQIGRQKAAIGYKCFDVLVEADRAHG